jgi:hypothetical protein
MEYKRNLVEYFKKNMSKGYTSEALNWALVNQGYSKVLVENCLIIANKELAEKAPKVKEKPIIKYEIIDEKGNPIEIKKPWWKRIF